MKRYYLAASVALSALTHQAASAKEGPTIAELQAQIDELKAIVKSMGSEPSRGRRVPIGRTDAGTLPAAGKPVESAVGRTDLAGVSRRPGAGVPLSKTDAGTLTAAGKPPESAVNLPFLLERPKTWGNLFAPPPSAADVNLAAAKPKTWFEKLTIRGYSQLRVNEFVSGERIAPGVRSRVRSLGDSSINEFGGFFFRRVRLIVQGDIHERVFLYFQTDFANAVNFQSVGGVATGEPRIGFAQVRDIYSDIYLDDAKTTKVRFGVQKIPFGWENLQSSQNRIPFDRTDAINTGIPGERDVGITGYYTPPQVQRIWDRLAKDGQKLFGNYGAFGLGVYNGQTAARLERNRNFQVVGMATWPFELDPLGPLFKGQVLELGGSAYYNQFRPELRAGGLSPISYDDSRVGLHAILYPQPFGLQAEYNWGEGPEFDGFANAIRTKPLEGGYIQAMYRIETPTFGQLYPYARLQSYRGGLKTALNAPGLETDEVEFGIEYQPIKPIEITLAYAKRRAREADERRFGQAEADLIRGQLQINY